MDESFAARSRADVRSGQPVEVHEVDICDPCEGCAPVFRGAATAESMPRRRRRRLRTVSRWRCRGGAQPRCVLNGIVRDGADPDLRCNDREAFALGGNSYGPMSSRRTTSSPEVMGAPPSSSPSTRNGSSCEPGRSSHRVHRTVPSLTSASLGQRRNSDRRTGRGAHRYPGQPCKPAPAPAQR